LVVLRIAFADEQTEIFESMVSQAEAALSNSPPDVLKAVGHLEYTHNYYPSGTQQIVGSRLDQIVERSRSCCERRITDRLREVAGEDLGSTPEAWIGRYGSRSSAPTGPGDSGASLSPSAAEMTDEPNP
jgi:hypothetical protein